MSFGLAHLAPAMPEFFTLHPDVAVEVSLGFTALFIAACLVVLWWIFRTGWRLKP